MFGRKKYVGDKAKKEFANVDFNEVINECDGFIVIAGNDPTKGNCRLFCAVDGSVEVLGYALHRAMCENSQLEKLLDASLTAHVLTNSETGDKLKELVDMLTKSPVKKKSRK